MKTTEERIRMVDAWYKGEMESIYKSRGQRAENYYNCIDDYSYGGLCDMADREVSRELSIEKDLKIEEIKNGGYHVENTYNHILKNLDGEIVSTTLVNTRYGKAFRIGDNKWVSVPVKHSTLIKKGYKLYEVESVYHLKFGGFSKKGNVIYDKINRVDMIERECGDRIKLQYSNSYIDWFYRTFESKR